MSFWTMLTIQIVATAGVVLMTLWAFWRLVVRPYLDQKVASLIEAGQAIESAVSRGVKKGVAESLRELPETAWDGTVKESTRQFLKFGSGLFENGLSSFLGSAADLERSRRDARTAGESTGSS